MMRIAAVLAVLFLVSAQAFAEEPGDADQLNYWSDWSDGEQNKEELPLPFEHFLQRIARRPRPQQFYGLMGKRDAEFPSPTYMCLQLSELVYHASYSCFDPYRIGEKTSCAQTGSKQKLSNHVGCPKNLEEGGYGPLSHKRHKTDSFVGLMGKRALSSGSSEWNTAQMYERRRK